MKFQVIGPFSTSFALSLIRARSSYASAIRNIASRVPLVSALAASSRQAFASRRSSGAGRFDMIVNVPRPNPGPVARKYMLRPYAWCGASGP